ncbi:MAG: hypothetical protein IPK57_08995 [Chitinophagaceae bacterium]|nr:hypothetical protein [Chitinophagaceae bacterium]
MMIELPLLLTHKAIHLSILLLIYQRLPINGCGFGGALATPVMNNKLYDTPSGTFDFNNPGTLLDNKMVTGIAPNDNPFTFNWARLGTALNNGNTTKD